MKLSDNLKISAERKFTEINSKIHWNKEPYVINEVIRRRK
jgi:hypothetical protein